MTIASETSRVNLVGDGVNDTFTFTFEIYVKTDLLVYVDNVLQEVDVNYTVPDAALENPDGGTIVFGAGDIPDDGAVVSIILNLPYTQLIDYVEASKFPAETHERGLDRLIKIAQQLKERIARQPVLLESSQYSDLTLPDPVANKFLAWNDGLTGLKNVEITSEGDLTVTDFIKTLLDDEDAATVFTTLGVTAFIKTLLDDADAATARNTLEVSPKTDVIKGDGTAGRILRCSQVAIKDATTADEIKCLLVNIWNGDTIAQQDDIGKGETAGNFTLDATGVHLYIEMAGLSGNVVFAKGFMADNATGIVYYPKIGVTNNDIHIQLSDESGVEVDLTGAVGVDAGDVYIDILYITDA